MSTQHQSLLAIQSALCDLSRITHAERGRCFLSMALLRESRALRRSQDLCEKVDQLLTFCEGRPEWAAHCDTLARLTEELTRLTEELARVSASPPDRVAETVDGVAVYRFG